MHHITNRDITSKTYTRKYTDILNIPSIKQLSLTATRKLIDDTYNNDNIISNDNIKHFGQIIVDKNLLWAINKKIVCDYVIQSFITINEYKQLIKFNITEDNNKRLFLSAFAALKSISDGHSHHLLIYSNNTNNSLIILEYIKFFIDNHYFDDIIPYLYYSNYNSKSENKTEIINNFKSSKFGIIMCVYCLSEGWDCPTLDAVVFSDNMYSPIRIVQSALRANRKNKDEPNKIMKIILIILNKDDWLIDNDNQDFKYIREIIYQLGLQDETIIHKLQVYNNKIESQTKKIINITIKDINNFKNYNEELTNQLKLKTMERSILGTSYKKAITIISNYNIKNPREYTKLCEINNKLPINPKKTYEGQFTTWIEYLSIKRIYYEFEECKKRITELFEIYPEITNNYLDLLDICINLCNIDSLFPPYDIWIEYYKINDLTEIIKINIDSKLIEY